MLTACGGLHEDLGEKNISINLPPIVADGNSRSISGERLPALRKEVRKYRVTVNGITREGTGSSYEFTLSVGIRATVTVECLNSDGEVIVRAVKDFTVMAGDNNVNINLKTDGNEIIPPAPEPVPNQVTYSYGEATIGNPVGLPSDPATYKEGDLFEVQDGSVIQWQHGNFTSWSASPAIESENSVQATDAPQAGQKYKMPAGGVTLTAQWTATPYTIIYNTDITSGGGSPRQASGGATDFTMLEKDDKQLSSTSDSTDVNTFLGWATASGASTANINGTADIRKAVANGSLQIGGGNSVTLYAVWTNLPTHTVTFDDSQLTVQEYWQGNSSNNTVNIIEGQSVSAQQVQSFLNGGAKQNYTLTYNGGGSGAITSPQNFTVQASNVTFNTTYTVTIDFSGVSSAAWWQTSSSITATRSVAKGGQLSAQDIQTEIDSRKKPNYNVTYNGGNKTISSASDINVPISASDLDVKELFSITYSWGTGVTVTAGNLPQMQDNIVQGTNATVTIPTGVTRSGYNFLGWSETDNDPSGNATYKTGSNTIAGIGKSYTLYAVWQIINYKVVYNGNGNTGGTAPAEQTYTVTNQNVQLAAVGSLVKTDCNFLGWNTTQGATAELSSLTFAQLQQQATGSDANNKTLTLYAVWQAKTGFGVTDSTGTETIYDDFDAAWTSQAADGGTIKLYSDTTITSPKYIGTITSGGNTTGTVFTTGTTLDLNGHTITYGDGGLAMCVVNENLSFTLKDSSSAGNGKISIGNNPYGIFVNAGTFTMEGGSLADMNYTGNGDDGDTAALGIQANHGNASAYMRGGSIKNNVKTIERSSSTVYACGVFVNAANADSVSKGGSAVFEMSGGSISNNRLILRNDTSGRTCVGAGICVMGEGTNSTTFKMSGAAEITGNTMVEGSNSAFKSQGGGIAVLGGTVEISGGTISGNSAIQGGGIYIKSTKNPVVFSMSGCTITGNNATNVYNSNGATTQTEGTGGGVYIATGSAGDVDFTQDPSASVTGNTAQVAGSEDIHRE